MDDRLELTEERMHDSRAPRAKYRRTALLAVLVAALGTTSAIAQTDYTLPVDRDQDGVFDIADRCPAEPGNLQNGCPSELNAEVRGRWQVNRLLTKLVGLTVAAPVGSRIELRCSGRIKICGKTRHVVARTTHRLTSLKKFFKRPRIYRARLSILVRVTKPLQIGYYKRYETRKGRRSPAVTERCLSPLSRVQPCEG